MKLIERFGAQTYISREPDRISTVEVGEPPKLTKVEIGWWLRPNGVEMAFPAFPEDFALVRQNG